MKRSLPFAAAFMAAFLCLSGCATQQPHFCESAESNAKAYCYARVNLNDLITAANLSRADGTLSESSHDDFIAKAKEADALLDAAEVVLAGGGTPDLTVVKALLLELQ